MSENRFKNQVVLVTGASSGIGRSAAIAFAQEGATTVLLSRSRERLEKVADEIREFSENVRVVPADVSSKEEVDAAIAKVVAELGRIDVLFNNAGRSDVGSTEAPWFVDGVREMFEVDFLGSVHVTQAVLPVMRRQGRGHILNMSSVVGRKAFAQFGGYSSVMHAIAGYTDALRQELKGTGIHVSIIHPALTQTPLLASVRSEDMPPPFRRLTPMTPERVADAALRGIVRNTSRIVVPSQPKLLFLADALSPRLGDFVVELLQNRFFSWLLRTFRGTRYQHGTP
jgi:NAD(P)-dependent dehydrogenase (short-subunit alcohol dehydrogenase family)